MTPPKDYLEQLSPDNAAVLFIDKQTTLTLGVQSIDLTLLKTSVDGPAPLAKIFKLLVVLTTTGGGADGPSGPLLKGITDALPDIAPVNRMGNLDAMDDPRFAAAVRATGRHKLILSGITTDVCLVYPALSMIVVGYHVFIPVDASGSWTSAINDAALRRLIQAGVTPTNVLAIAGELQKSTTNKDAGAAKALMPQMMEWIGSYTPAPSTISMNGSYKAG